MNSSFSHSNHGSTEFDIKKTINWVRVKSRKWSNWNEGENKTQVKQGCHQFVTELFFAKIVQTTFISNKNVT